MNRVIGFALIGGFLASFATASGAAANQVRQEGTAILAAPAVQQPLASVEQPSPVPVAPLAPSNTTHRIITAAEPAARAPLAPAAEEPAPASQASLSSCPPAHTDVACRKP